MAPCSAPLFLGSALHGGGTNRTSVRRTGMVMSYCLGSLKSYENQWLVYPPEVARGFPRPLAALAGYQQHRPNLGNYEGRCSSILLDGAPADSLGAVDELRPEQATALGRRRALHSA
jgi:ectoine hydroxylase-related dioxygenase (phytanoyl-CoA dioxygenase family)